MKRPSDEDPDRAASADSKAEDFLAMFFEKHPKFFLYFGIGLSVLIVVALAIVKLSGQGH